MKTLFTKLPLIFSFLLIGAALLAPLEAQDADCATVLQTRWADASSACINQPSGYVCNGGDPPAAEPSGLVSNSLAPLGALVDVTAVHAIRTAPVAPESNSLGVAWLRLPAPLNLTMLMIGNVTLFDVTPPDLPAWTSSVIQTSTALPACAAAPRNLVVLQTSSETRLTINSVSLDFTGTVLVATDDTSTIFMTLEGQTSVLAMAQQQTVPPGEQVSVAYQAGNVSAAGAPPGLAIPLDNSYLNNLPVPLFDRPLILPQSGFASTQGAVNLRVSPDLYSSVITQVPGGQPLTVLGSNPDQTWYNVRLGDGQTGWMLAELLASNIGAITTTYSQTPLPPQRYGDLGTRGRVHAPNGVNLRRGPDVTFPAIGIIADGTLVDLLARSPYQNGWIKVDDNGTIGWLSLLTLETQAYLDALPIDYNAPPMPTPTVIPGSFGNAYPDPNGE